MSFAVLAIVIGTGTAVVMGAIYLMNDEDELDHLDEMGLYLAIVGVACLPFALLYSNALFFAVAGLSGAGAILAARLIIPFFPLAYLGGLAVIGIIFSLVLIKGLLDINLAKPERVQVVSTPVMTAVERTLSKTILWGTVMDPASQPVTNAQVTLKGPLILSRPESLEVATNASGTYRLDIQTRGTYEVRVVADGFETTTKRVVVDTHDTEVQALILRQKPKYEVIQEVGGINIVLTPTATATSLPTPIQPRRSEVTAPTTPSDYPQIVFTLTATATRRAATATRRLGTATPVRSIKVTATPTPRVIQPSSGGFAPAGPQMVPNNVPTVAPTASSTAAPAATPTLTATAVPTTPPTSVPTVATP